MNRAMSVHRPISKPAQLATHWILPLLGLMPLVIAIRSNGEPAPESASTRYETTAGPDDSRSGLHSGSIAPIRPVRVTVVSNAIRVRISGEKPIQMIGADGAERHPDVRLGSSHAIEIRYSEKEGIRFGEWMSHDTEAVLDPGPGGTIRLSSPGPARFDPGPPGVARVDSAWPPQDTRWSAEAEYAGMLRVLVSQAGLLNVINLIDVEEYVAGVVASEVWPTFHIEALRAQAIAARSYVLYQMNRRNQADADLSATQSSQVYRGRRDDDLGRKSRDAAAYTRGIVLTYLDENGRDQLFCAYYSSACGGASQSASIFEPEGDRASPGINRPCRVPPLRGGVQCDYCRIAPGDAYRWGPVRIPMSEVLSRLTSRFPEFADLNGISSIESVESTPYGRPITVQISDSGGASRDLLAERFRLAIDGSLIKSTDFRVRVHRNEVIFDNGKGFGHGLGLCQWGAQGQALKGRPAGDILRYYYPDARLTRVY